jgi:hypothetical protein
MIEPPLPTARRHYSTNIGTTDKVDADLDQAEKRVAEHFQESSAYLSDWLL